ncbi:unnamed protein product [Medioppia subpectinata]|uniref:Uncharacterized protein n=1 Tax=Medioppia subpectinata TaxID=1979941 RepID=A0A7R9KZC7_9ACAR|nr:unnamed protein product [Medioppia subpectinata]CAG2112393.1 unnamed protein product [Medioppia subpectinata]
MNMLILLPLLVGSCLATPIQPQPQGYNIKTIKGRQFRDEIRSSDGIVYGKYGFQDPTGGLRIVKYTAGKDGIQSQGDGIQAGPPGSGIPISSQPIVWNSNEPIYVDQAPLTYGSYNPSVRHQSEPFITERDQQRYLNIDESIDGVRDEVIDDSKPVTEPKSEVEPKDESKDRQPVNDQQQPSLLVSGVSPVNVQRQVLSGDDHIFPQVLFGQRRLVEPQTQQQPQQQQQYAIKGKSLVRPIVGYGQPLIPRQQVVYQTVQQPQQFPISVEDHRVSSQGVKRPVIEYQVRPVQQQQQVQQQVQPHVPREWVRKPSYQVLPAQGVKGYSSQRNNYQYFIQPVIPSVNIDLIQRQPQQQQVYQQQVYQQQVPQVLSLTHEQQVPLVDQRRDLVDQRIVVQQQDSHVGHDVDHRPLPVGQDLKTQDIVSQKQAVKTPVVGDHKVVIHESVRQSVPTIIGGHRVISYQLPTQQLQQQQFVYPQVQQYYTGSSIPSQPQQQQQPIQHSLPISDLQQYYSLIAQTPIQYDNQYVSYIGGQQPYQYSSPIDQQVPQQQVSAIQGQEIGTEQPTQFGVGQGVQGVQQVRVQGAQQHLSDDLSVVGRGQDQRVPQRQQQIQYSVDQNHGDFIKDTDKSLDSLLSIDLETPKETNLRVWEPIPKPNMSSVISPDLKTEANKVVDSLWPNEDETDKKHRKKKKKRKRKKHHSSGRQITNMKQDYVANVNVVNNNAGAAGVPGVNTTTTTNSTATTVTASTTTAATVAPANIVGNAISNATSAVPAVANAITPVVNSITSALTGILGSLGSAAGG